MSAPSVTPASARSRPPARVLALAAVLVLSLAAFVVSFAAGWIDQHAVQRWLDEPGPLSMLAYVAIVFALELLWCPRMWGLLAGGLVFGPLRGTLLSIVADLLSAAFCYALARGAARDWVDERLRRRPRAHALVELLARQRGAVTVGLLRVLPVHYTAASYASGLAGVSWGQFMLGTAVGVVPGAVLYPLVGDSIRDPASPAFIGGVVVWVCLGVLGALYARRLWRRGE